MRFARVVFASAGASGLAGLLPMYFLEARIGRALPPPIAHPELFYGFLGVAAAWQVGFLVIARDPARFRPMMIPAVLEKGSFGFAALALGLGGRLSGPLLAAGLLDLALGILFLAAFLRTPDRLDR